MAIQYLDYTFSLPLSLATMDDSGNTSDRLVTLRAHLTGNPDGPVILVLGGISANRHVCPFKDADGKLYSGWWQDIAGDGLALDTNRFRILSFDFLPNEDLQDNCRVREASVVTPADQAYAALALCNALNIAKLYAFVGASYGGMIALNFAHLFPERVSRLVVLCASHRPHTMGMAWRSIQRKIVRFGLETQQPERALSLARELGMTTYRTAQEFDERFASRHEVESYLENRGQAFIGRMSPQRYLTLSESIDWHEVPPEAVHVPATVIGFKQDQLIAVEDLRYLSQKLPSLSHYFEGDSIFGHDGFLKEISFISNALQQALVVNPTQV